jgi:hypothetical protein
VAIADLPSDLERGGGVKYAARLRVEAEHVAHELLAAATTVASTFASRQRFSLLALDTKKGSPGVAVRSFPLLGLEP